METLKELAKGALNDLGRVFTALPDDAADALVEAFSVQQALRRCKSTIMRYHWGTCGAPIGGAASALILTLPGDQ